MPSPKDHPNAFAALSSASVSTFLVAEAKRRLGVDISVEEAGFIVAFATSAVLFIGKKVGVKKSA